MRSSGVESRDAGERSVLYGAPVIFRCPGIFPPFRVDVLESRHTFPGGQLSALVDHVFLQRSRAIDPCVFSLDDRRVASENRRVFVRGRTGPLGVAKRTSAASRFDGDIQSGLWLLLLSHAAGGPSFIFPRSAPTPSDFHVLVDADVFPALPGVHIPSGS